MKTPFKNRPLSLPGQSVDETLNDYLYDKVFFYFVLIVVSLGFIVLEWTRFYFETPPRPVLITITLLSIMMFLSYRLWKNVLHAKNLYLGREGERFVGQLLEEMRADGCHVFHDIQTLAGDKKFNIDHVLVCPQGIFTVETKTWSKKSKREKLRFDGENIIANGYKSNKYPVEQSLSQARWLSDLFKTSLDKSYYVKPTLVFPGWYIEPEDRRRAGEKDVWLLNPNALSAFIKNSPTSLGEEDINLVSAFLRSLNK